MTSEPSTRDTVAAALVGAGLVCVSLLITATALSSARNDVDRLAYGDGLLYRYAAQNLSTPEERLDPVFRERGPALRFGRIGLPALLVLFSAGNHDVMPWVQAAIMIASGAAAAAASVRLFPRAGPLAGVIPFLVPGFALAASGGYAEAPAMAAVLWALVMAEQRRWTRCGVLLSFALLCRENAATVLLAFAVLVLLRRDGIRALLSVCAAGLPALAWWGVVWSRYGVLPPLDPYLSVHTNAVGPPLVMPWRSLTEPLSTGGLVLFLFHAMAFAVLLFLALRARNRYGVLGAVIGTQLLVSGPFAWVFLGDAARTSVFLEMAFVLALVAVLRPSWPARPAVL